MGQSYIPISGEREIGSADYNQQVIAESEKIFN